METLQPDYTAPEQVQPVIEKNEKQRRADIMRREIDFQQVEKSFSNETLYKALNTPEIERQLSGVHTEGLKFFIQQVILPQGQESMSFFQALSSRIGLDGGIQKAAAKEFLIQLGMHSLEELEQKNNPEIQPFLERLRSFVDGELSQTPEAEAVRSIYEQIRVSHEYQSDIDQVISDIVNQRPEHQGDMLIAFMKQRADIPVDFEHLTRMQHERAEDHELFGIERTELAYLLTRLGAVEDSYKTQEVLHFLTYIRNNENIRDNMPAEHWGVVKELAAVANQHPEEQAVIMSILYKVNHHLRYIEESSKVFREIPTIAGQEDVDQREAFLAQPIEIPAQSGEHEELNITDEIQQFALDTALNNEEALYIVQVLTENQSQKIEPALAFLRSVVSESSVTQEHIDRFAEYTSRLMYLMQENENAPEALIMKKLMNTKDHHKFQSILEQEKGFEQELINNYNEAITKVQSIRRHIKKYLKEVEVLRSGLNIDEGSFSFEHGVGHFLKGTGAFMMQNLAKLTAVFAASAAAVTGALPVAAVATAPVFIGYRYVKGRLFDAGKHENRIAEQLNGINQNIKSLDRLGDRMKQTVEAFQVHHPAFDSQASQALVQDITPRVKAIGYRCMNHENWDSEEFHFKNLVPSVVYKMKHFGSKSPQMALEDIPNIQDYGDKKALYEHVYALIDHCDQIIAQLRATAGYIKNGQEETISFNEQDALISKNKQQESDMQHKNEAARKQQQINAQMRRRSRYTKSG